MRPTDLPELRQELIEWTGSPKAELYWESYREANADKTTTMMGLAPSVLRETELFWVSPQMMELAVAAAASLPDFAIQPEDLPAPSGFLYSPEPLGLLGSVDRDGAGAESIQDGRIVGVCWTSTGEAVFTSFLFDRDGYVDQLSTPDNDWIRRNLPRVFERIHNMVLMFNDPCAEDLEAYTAGGETDPRRQPARVMLTIWLMMMQTLADDSPADYDRATRKRLQRKKIDPAKVRVITLRRHAGSTGDGASSREYHHQWLVRGHWRQQWYSKRAVHRPVWIAPHVKGPEGQPFLGGDKVHVWKR